MTMRYDSISHVGHFDYTLFQKNRKECATKARLVVTTHFRLYTIWQKDSTGYQSKKIEDYIDSYEAATKPKGYVAHLVLAKSNLNRFFIVYFNYESIFCIE
ncbi:hypothetical protein ABEX57_24190 [Bacillus anthracis]|uniref:hypothetical protein n=1 Tax=Bacillus anthracis TaxID=1392 RepID=UPI003D1E340D